MYFNVKGHVGGWMGAHHICREQEFESEKGERNEIVCSSMH